MPLGSSSDAPAIRPGPRTLSNDVFLFLPAGAAFSILAPGLRNSSKDAAPMKNASGLDPVAADTKKIIGNWAGSRPRDCVLTREGG